MSETEIKIVLDKDEAAKRLAELDDSLDSAADEAERLDKATKSSSGPAVRRGRPAPRSGGGGGGFGAAAGKAFAVAAAAVIAVQVAETVVSAVGQKFESWGLSGIGQTLQDLSAKATEITSVLAKVQGATAAVTSVLKPFAESGVDLPPGALLEAAKIGAARATREAQLSKRKQARGLVAYVDTAARLARQL